MLIVLFCFLFPATEPFERGPIKGLKWEPLYEPGTGSRIAFAAQSPHDPELLLAGGWEGGIWRSEDHALSWKPSPSDLPFRVQTILFHPQDPKKVLAGTLAGPFASTDCGRTWHRKRSGWPPPSQGYFTAPVSELVSVPGRPDTVLAGTGATRTKVPAYNTGRIYKTENWGEEWELVEYGLGDVRAMAFSTQEPSRVLLAASRGIFYSRSRGGAWARSLKGFQAKAGISVAAAPGKGPCFVASIRGEGTFLSTDGGFSWKKWQKGLPQDSAPVTLSWSTQKGDPVLAGLRGAASGLWYRRPGEGPWERVNSIEKVAKKLSDPLLMAGISQQGETLAWSLNNLFFLPEDKTDWISCTTRKDDPRRGSGLSMDHALGVAFSRCDRELFAIVGRSHCWLTQDGGKSFTFSANGLPGGFPRSGIALSRRKKRRVFLWSKRAGKNAQVFLSNNTGRNWRKLLELQCENFHDFLPSKHCPLTFLCLSDRQVLRTVNKGKAWRPVLYLPESREGGRFTLDPTHPRRIFLTWGGNAGGLWRSLDGGRVWRRIFPVLPHARGHVGVTSRGEILICADQGVYRLEKKKWTKLKESAFSAIDLAVAKGRIVIALFSNLKRGAVKSSGRAWYSPDFGRSWYPLRKGLSGTPPSVIAASSLDQKLVLSGTEGGGFFRLKWPEKEQTETSDSGRKDTAPTVEPPAPFEGIKQTQSPGS